MLQTMTFTKIILIIIILRILVHLGILLACLRLFLLLLDISFNQILLILFPIPPLPNATNLLPTPYLPRNLRSRRVEQSRTTNTHVQAELVQVVEAAINEFTSYVNVKIGGLITKVLFDSGCSKSFISIDHVRKIHAKLQPLETADTSFMIGISRATMHCLARIGVNVLLNYFPVYTEFLVLNHFTQQAILGLVFLNKTKALLNFDLGLISFYSGLIELPFARQIPSHTLAYTISDVELPPFSDTYLIPIRVVNNGFKCKTSYIEARFSGINQLYAMGRSLSDIDSEGMTIC